MKNRTEVGRFLQLSRINRGLSLEDAGEALGYGNGQFIWNWEAGKAMPPMAKLATIAKLYKISIVRLKYVMYLQDLVKLKLKYGIPDATI